MAEATRADLDAAWEALCKAEPLVYEDLTEVERQRYYAVAQAIADARGRLQSYRAASLPQHVARAAALLADELERRTEAAEKESDELKNERDRLAFRLRDLAVLLRDAVNQPVGGPLNTEDFARMLIEERDALKSTLAERVAELGNGYTHALALERERDELRTALTLATESNNDWARKYARAHREVERMRDGVALLRTESEQLIGSPLGAMVSAQEVAERCRSLLLPVTALLAPATEQGGGGEELHKTTGLTLEEAMDAVDRGLCVMSHEGFYRAKIDGETSWWDKDRRQWSTQFAPFVWRGTEGPFSIVDAPQPAEQLSEEGRLNARPCTVEDPCDDHLLGGAPKGEEASRG